MRVWDQIEANKLCRKHLLAEHRETLAIWSILTNNKKGYRNHPEVKRWKGKEIQLYFRHQHVMAEAKSRGYNFKDLPTDELFFYNKVYTGWPKPWDNQLETLKLKGCECQI